MTDQVITWLPVLYRGLGMLYRNMKLLKGNQTGVSTAVDFTEQLFVNWNSSWKQARNLPPNVATFSSKVLRLSPLLP